MECNFDCEKFITQITWEGQFPFYFSAVDIRCRLSAGMASASSTSKLICGVFRSCFSRWKDIGRTVIRPISLRRVTAGADAFPAVFHSNQP
jgi:hypothetical protein